MTRREVGRHGAAFLLALGGLPLARGARAEDEALVSDLPGNEALLRGVQYVSKSVRDGQRCESCVLYQPRGGSRGKCALFQAGLVPAEAWCISWSPKPS